MANKSVQQLDLNLLKVFEAMYREQNMSRVAEVLFITPSAVSHAIKRLRNALQDPLFERQGNKMKPTSACLRIAPQLLESLHGVRASLQQFTEFNPVDSEQTFTIAIHDALESLYAPRLYKHLAEVSDKLSLACVKLERSQIQRQLGSGQADLAVDVAMPLQRPIQHARIAEDSFVVLFRKSEQRHDENITREQYLGAKHLTVSNRPSGRVVEDINLQQQSINRQIGMRCQNYQTAKALLKMSELLLTCPRLIGETLKDEDLHMADLPIDVPQLELHLYWHENTSNDSAITWLRDTILGLSRTSAR